MKRETARVRELGISAPSQYGNIFYPAGEDGMLRVSATGRASMAVPPIPARFLNSEVLGDRRSELSGVISPPPPSHALDVDESEYYAPSPAFSNFTLNASQTSLDDYAHHSYASRGGQHSVLLPPLPHNPYTNPAGYQTPQAHNFPFENNTEHSHGDHNSLTQSAAMPAGVVVDDGQWRPSVLQPQRKPSKGGWFKWGHRGGKSKDYDSERERPRGRPGTSWFEDD